MLYVDLPSSDELGLLARFRADACVSAYLPTHAVTQHSDIDRLQLRALAETAVAQLADKGLGRLRLELLEAGLKRLIADHQFWRFQARSLAVLATPDELRTYRLPSHLRPSVDVSDRFHLKPLVRAISFPAHALVLAFSQDVVRLIEVAAGSPGRELDVPELPAGLAEVLGRATGRTPATPSKLQGEGRKVAIEKYAREVDAALRPVLTGRKVPLVLAGVAYVTAIYRSVNTYPHLLADDLQGNAELVSAQELGEQARGLADRFNAGTLAELNRRFAAWRAHGRASSDLAQVARAAVAGAVDTLLFDIDGAVHGRLADTGEIEVTQVPSADTYDLVDEIMDRTMLTGGTVLGVRAADLPDAASPLAALLRYPA